MSSTPKLYTELTSWWQALSHPADYAEEAEFYRKTLMEICPTPPRSLLELGCGGGNNASHLKAHFTMTLVDLSPGMLEVSRELNPGCEHILGDMRTVRLESVFDAVFIHDAIMYMTSRQALQSAIETAYVHCRRGGAALFAPDCTRDTFKTKTDHGGHDLESRSMRYLAWTLDPDPEDETFITDFAYLLRDEDETMTCEYDRHLMGLFPRQAWVELIALVGFEPYVIPFEHSEIEPGTCDVFIGIKR